MKAVRWGGLEASSLGKCLTCSTVEKAFTGAHKRGHHCHRTHPGLSQVTCGKSCQSKQDLTCCVRAARQAQAQLIRILTRTKGCTMSNAPALCYLCAAALAGRWQTPGGESLPRTLPLLRLQRFLGRKPRFPWRGCSTADKRTDNQQCSHFRPCRINGNLE